jgi:PAS domain S-box-containing protein
MDDKTLRFAESKVIGLDGKTRDVEAISILTQLNGKPSVMIVGRDITERKRLEKALKESEEQYRKLVEFSPNGIIIHKFSEITYVNPAGVRNLGATSSEDLVGKSILDFIHPDYHEQVRERWEIIRKDKKPVEFLEEKMIRLDHQTIDVEIMGIPMTSLPLISKGNSIDPTILSATLTASSSYISGKSMVNSSPANRDKISCSRTQVFKRSATPFKRRSPDS